MNPYKNIFPVYIESMQFGEIFLSKFVSKTLWMDFMKKSKSVTMYHIISQTHSFLMQFFENGNSGYGRVLSSYQKITLGYWNTFIIIDVKSEKMKPLVLKLDMRKML